MKIKNTFLIHLILGLEGYEYTEGVWRNGNLHLYNDGKYIVQLEESNELRTATKMEQWRSPSDAYVSDWYRRNGSYSYVELTNALNYLIECCHYLTTTDFDSLGRALGCKLDQGVFYYYDGLALFEIGMEAQVYDSQCQKIITSVELPDCDSELLTEGFIDQVNLLGVPFSKVQEIYKLLIGIKLFKQNYKKNENVRKTK